MTTLLWSMVRARSAVAAIMLVIGMAAAAAAAAGPLYRQAAGAAIVSVEVDRAPVAERLLSAQRVGDDQKPLLDGEPPPLPHLTGFRTISGRQVTGSVLGDAGGDHLRHKVWLATRTGFCREVVLTAGRCAVADHEVLVREDTAELTGARVGSEVVFDPADTRSPVALSVVGLYRTPQPQDAYWAQRRSLVGADGGVFLTTERTVERAGRTGLQTVDLVAGPTAFANLQRLRVEITRAAETLVAGGYTPDTGIRDLADRVDRNRRTLGDSLTIAILPLVLLCWFVLFLAAAGAAEQRRGELGLAVLRGVPTRLRWLLPSVETALPMLLAAVPGYLVGLGATAAYSALVLPGAPDVSPSWTSMAYAAAAVLGALLAGLLAQVRILTAPLLSLLRRVGARRRSGVVGAAEVVIGALAIAAGYQLSLTGGEVDSGGGGIALVAPLCISLGLGLVASRALVSPADRLGRWALRHGRLALGIAAMTLARRPESNRIVALLTVALGLVGFAVTANDTAQRAWTQRSRLETGAARALSVQQASVPALLAAVRTVDPQGTYAMAVAGFQVPGTPPVLGVDSARLANVAIWSSEFGPLSPADVAQRLRPAPPQPLELRAARLELTVTLVDIAPGATARVGVRLTTQSGAVVVARTDELRPGEHRYSIAVPPCTEAACRLDEIAPEMSVTRRHRINLILGPIRDGTNGALLTDTARIAEPDRWRQPTPSAARPVAELRGTPGGLGMAVDSPLWADLRIFPATVAEPLPMVATAPLPDDVLGHGGARRIEVTRAGEAALVPRHGTAGALVDLEYADELSLDVDPASMEVWLAADAPPDVADRLRAAGLTVTDDRSVVARRAVLASQAPAFALRFLLMAAYAAVVFAMGSILVTAALERGHPADGLAALREHGVPGRTLRAVAVLRRCGLVILAAALGLAATAVSWWLARDVLPMYVAAERTMAVPPPVVPTIAGVAVPVAGAVLVLLLTCWFAGRLASGKRQGRGT
ncbi:hypothetical protein ONA91_39135 [Micromonospora sp. DR5-3]|uniref:FtsX-like permease family protein n=1 Tax=unclassified Micromonospora TaxID=2617518 RepID=UPI0011D5E999|nr:MULTISPECIES: FtsX-like permease family protein [unclassified Micromonospora]MCW3820463.1 hypothetical protein [Micromonospora sp. DR5-3]TYC20651.1 hypothetical protein FXF52_30085 [Micromonospora sp. MP36]